MTALVHAEDAVRGASLEDRLLVEALRDGDEEAFASLVGAYHGSLVRLALVYVRDRGVAEEVVQETWLGVIRGLERFEGRSSLKTWIQRILANTAKIRAERERRSIPFSSLARADDESGDSAVELERFLDPSHPSRPGAWASPPSSWCGIPEECLVAKETRARIQEAVATLPPMQRTVITLRDIEGWSSEAVCELLALGEVNQRVLLHRARSKVRRSLEDYLAEV